LDERSEQSLMKVANEVYIALQVVLEFIDKGVKGLLTGDMSVFLV